jgi:hypothetical protein
MTIFASQHPYQNYYECSKLQKKLVITGMKRIFVCTYKLYLFYVKTRINNEITIQTISDNDFLKTLKKIVVDYDSKLIVNLRTFFESGIGPTDVKTVFLVPDINSYTRYQNVLS